MLKQRQETELLQIVRDPDRTGDLLQSRDRRKALIDKLSEQAISKEITLDDIHNGFSFNSIHERAMAKGLLQNNLRVLFEPMTLLTGPAPKGVKFDFVSNLYFDGRITVWEVHGLEWARNWYSDEEIAAQLKKYSVAITRHPEIFLNVSSDMAPGKIKKLFGLRPDEFCDGYGYETSFEMGVVDRFANIVRNFIKHPNVKIEKNENEWHSDIRRVMEVEVMKLKIDHDSGNLKPLGS